MGLALRWDLAIARSIRGAIHEYAFSTRLAGPCTVKSEVPFDDTIIEESAPADRREQCSLYAARAAPPEVSPWLTITVRIASS
jgi:hypothetical protein